MAGHVVRYRAKTTHAVYEISEDGWVGVQKARKWCQEIAEEASTVDLYCLLLDGTELYDSTHRRERNTDNDFLVSL